MSAPTTPDHRIVVGVDGSRSSVAALHWAARQARLTGSTIEAVTTWEWPTTFGVAFSLPTGYDPVADAQKVLDRALDPVRGTYPDVTFIPIVMEGHPAPALVEASRGAELLVVGSRGYREYTGILLGSVSEHCVTTAHCPVLVFRDDD